MISIQTLTASRALVRIDDRARVVDISDLPEITNTHWDGFGLLPDEFKKIVERFEQTHPKQPGINASVRGHRIADQDDDKLRKARRKALREIAAEVTAARDRGFGETADKYTPSKGLELARFVDLLFLYSQGRLKDDDQIWARNWWTGHQEKVTVRTIVDSIADGFRFRQLLRQHEQERREEVEEIFNDESKSIDERVKQLEALEIPRYLDLPETESVAGVEQKLKRNVARE